MAQLINNNTIFMKFDLIFDLCRILIRIIMLKFLSFLLKLQGKENIDSVMVMQFENNVYLC